jgi:hypothetical protein
MRPRADARSAMTSGICESGLSRSSHGLTRHAWRHADSESGLAGPWRLSRAGRNSKRPSPSLSQSRRPCGQPASSQNSRDESVKEDVASSPRREGAAHGLPCKSDPPHVRPSDQLLCRLPNILTTRRCRNSCPDLHQHEIPHVHRRTPLQERRRGGSQRRPLTSPSPSPPPPPPPSIVPPSVPTQPSSGGRTNTDGSQQEIGDCTTATSPCFWRSIPLP